MLPARLALLAFLLVILVLPSGALAQNGPQAYHGVRVTGELSKDLEPQSTAASYDGPALQLQGAYVGREAAEPTIGVDLEGNAYYAASAFDALGIDGIAARTKIFRSTDGGLTWADTNPKVPGIEEDLPPTTLDPYVYVDNKTGRVFSIDLAGAGSFLTYSDDKGETWETSAISSPGVNDHQSFSTAPPPEGNPLATTSDIFPNLLYYCVNHVSDARCSYSNDGGRSFRPAGSPAFSPVDGCTGALHGHLEGGPDGTIYLPAGRCGYPWISVSKDAGLTWTEVQVSDKIDSGETHNAVGIDSAGNVYYVWYDTTHLLPWMSTSTDGGMSWSAPLMIAPPGVHGVNFPEIIAGDEGRVAIIFPGTPVDDVEVPERPWNSYMVVSTNALDPNPLFVSNIANPASDPIHRGNCNGRCAGMFDFMEVTVSPADGAAWASATDTCTALDDCNAPDGVQANDSQGVAVRQLAGPWLVGATPRGGAPGSTTVPAPTPAPPAPRPVAPSARKAKLTCKRSGSRAARCSVRLATAPGGAKASLKLLSGKRVIASGSGAFKKGAALVRLRSKRAMKIARYRLEVTISLKGAKSSRATRTLSLRR